MFEFSWSFAVLFHFFLLSSLSQPSISVINFTYCYKDQIFPFITSAVYCLVARYLENQPETELFDVCVSHVETWVVLFLFFFNAQSSCI